MITPAYRTSKPRVAGGVSCFLQLQLPRYTAIAPPRGSHPPCSGARTVRHRTDSCDGKSGSEVHTPTARIRLYAVATRSTAAPRPTARHPAHWRCASPGNCIPHSLQPLTDADRGWRRPMVWHLPPPLIRRMYWVQGLLNQLMKYRPKPVGHGTAETVLHGGWHATNPYAYSIM